MISHDHHDYLLFFAVTKVIIGLYSFVCVATTVPPSATDLVDGSETSRINSSIYYGTSTYVSLTTAPAYSSYDDTSTPLESSPTYISYVDTSKLISSSVYSSYDTTSTLESSSAYSSYDDTSTLESSSAYSSPDDTSILESSNEVTSSWFSSEPVSSIVTEDVSSFSLDSSEHSASDKTSQYPNTPSTEVSDTSTNIPISTILASSSLFDSIRYLDSSSSIVTIEHSTMSDIVSSYITQTSDITVTVSMTSTLLATSVNNVMPSMSDGSSVIGSGFVSSIAVLSSLYNTGENSYTSSFDSTASVQVPATLKTLLQPSTSSFNTMHTSIPAATTTPTTTTPTTTTTTNRTTTPTPKTTTSTTTKKMYRTHQIPNTYHVLDVTTLNVVIAVVVSANALA